MPYPIMNTGELRILGQEKDKGDRPSPDGCSARYGAGCKWSGRELETDTADTMDYARVVGGKLVKGSRLDRR